MGTAVRRSGVPAPSKDQGGVTSPALRKRTSSMRPPASGWIGCSPGSSRPLLLRHREVVVVGEADDVDRQLDEPVVEPPPAPDDDRELSGARRAGSRP